MIILVTGSAGFIGYHLTKSLLKEGHSVVGVDNFNDYYDVSLKEARSSDLKENENYKEIRGNISDLDLVKKIFSENKIDKVCNLAAQAGVRYSLVNPHAYIRSNLVGFTNILEEAKNANVKDVIYASSSSVYGKNKKTPFSVNDNVDKPISLYAATKKSNELIAHAYHHLYDMNMTGLRFFTVYGPYGRPDMAAFLFADAISKGEPIKVFNNGKMRRDFTFIDDIVKGIKRSLEKSYPYEVFNLGNNSPVELEYFISLIEKAMGKEAKKDYLPLQPGDVVETYADIEYTKEKLDWQPETSIEEGVEEFISWYRRYYNIKF